jgi:hypothetical protein
VQHRCSTDPVRRSRGRASARPDAPCRTPVGRRKPLADAAAHLHRARSRFSLVCGAVKGVVGEWGLGLQFPPRRRFCVSAKCSWPSIWSRRSSFHWAGGSPRSQWALWGIFFVGFSYGPKFFLHLVWTKLIARIMLSCVHFGPNFTLYYSRILIQCFMLFSMLFTLFYA